MALGFHNAIKAVPDILCTGRIGHENYQPSSNGNLSEVVRSCTVEHFEDNMADNNREKQCP